MVHCAFVFYKTYRWILKMMSTARPNFGDYVIALGGQFIGWLGASLLLATIITHQDIMLVQNIDLPFYKDPNLTLKGLAGVLMSIGPIVAAPAMIRSGWLSKQPSLALAGVAFFIMWMAIASDVENVLYRGILIFMVGFLFFGMSNIVMDEKRDFDFGKLGSFAGFLELGAFIFTDVLIALKVGIEGIFQIVGWPLRALLRDDGLPPVPSVLSSKSLWKSRRFGGVFFSVAGIFGILGATIPSFESTGLLLFNIVGGLSALIVNYSWFHSGLQGTHWLSKLLIPGSVLATLGSAARAFTWGFALDQFGSRLNEMYICGMPLITKQEEADKAEKAEQIASVTKPSLTPNTNDQPHTATIV
jgi:hypothetical protein